MINGTTFVTVASDASCGTDATGYAFYIRDDGGTSKHAWRSDHKQLSSTKAEIVAMLNALRVIHSREYPKGTKLIYYCDNQTALKVLCDDFTKKNRPKYQGAIAMAQQFIAGLEIEARHVKSHTGKDGLKRYYLNRWCDFNARAMMKYNRLHKNTRRTKSE